MRAFRTALLLVFAYIFMTASAGAFCLFSCTPTDANARSAFEKLVRGQFGSAPINIVSFEKTNGVEGNLAGVQFYEFSYTALVELPSGANPECNSQGSSSAFDQLGCMSNQKRYYPPGYKIRYDSTFAFEKTERGWRGPDGNLY